MKPSSRINSPSIDIEAFLDGLDWNDPQEVALNRGALASGVELLQAAILNNLIVPPSIDFKLLTRTLQDSDPLFKVCGILEGFISTQTGESIQFKEVAADLSLLREILAGLVKYGSEEPGEVRKNAFRVYIELLPKIHTHFFVTEDVLLQWKASVMLEQQVSFVAALIGENEHITDTDALLRWGNDYLKTIASEDSNDDAPAATEVSLLLANLRDHYLELLQSEIKREIELYDDKIVLTPPTHEHALSGFSELIFRARKEAEKDAKFQLTLDFEAVPKAAPLSEQKGPVVPVQPVHLKRRFQTPFDQMTDVQNLIHGFVASLQEEVNSGVFKDQDAQSLKGWFTDSIIPWVQSDEVVLLED